MCLHPPTVRPRLRRLAAALLLAAVPALSAAVSPAAPAGGSDLWYAVTIAGEPVGSVHEVTAVEDGAVRSLSTLKLVLNRLGTRVEMGMIVITRETLAGDLLGIDTELLLSTQSTSTHLSVEDGRVRLRDRAGDRDFERTVPFTGELLGPEGLRRRSAAGLRKPGDRIELQTWVADLGAVRRVTRTVIAEETLPGLGTTWKVEETIEGHPASQTVWLDTEPPMPVRGTGAEPPQWVEDGPALLDYRRQAPHAELGRAAQRILSRRNLCGLVNESVLVQELVDGTQYVVDTLSRDGRHSLSAVWRYGRPAFAPSRSTRCRRSLLAVSTTEAWVAWACRATLVRASCTTR